MATILNPIMAHAQDEQLAALFSRNLTFQPQVLPIEPTAVAAAPAAESQKIVYISQHYTHTAHVPTVTPQEELASPQELQRSSSEPPPTELRDLEALLKSHGVNTDALSAPQVDLFRAADNAQKLRLIQLWSIYPTTPGRLDSNNLASDHPSLTWSTTTMDQEETLARIRMEQQVNGLSGQCITMSLDGTAVQTTQPLQNESGHWGTQGVQTHQLQQQQQENYLPYAVSYMEPYMMSGYEEMARREYLKSAQPEQSRYENLDMLPVDGCAMPYSLSTDPVYKMTTATASAESDWHRQQQQQQQQRMENQYGQLSGWADAEML